MSDTINDGGPAFPLPTTLTQGNRQIVTPESFRGMTLRDYFAAKAMAQYLNAQQRDLLEIENGTSPYKGAHDASDIAELSYAIADAMLRARGVK